MTVIPCFPTSLLGFDRRLLRRVFADPPEKLISGRRNPSNSNPVPQPNRKLTQLCAHGCFHVDIPLAVLLQLTLARDCTSLCLRSVLRERLKTSLYAYTALDPWTGVLPLELHSFVRFTSPIRTCTIAEMVYETILPFPEDGFCTSDTAPGLDPAGYSARLSNIQRFYHFRTWTQHDREGFLSAQNCGGALTFLFAFMMVPSGLSGGRPSVSLSS